MNIRDPRIELMPKEELKELQAKKLMRQLKYVYTLSPFYAKKFDKAGLKPVHVAVMHVYAQEDAERLKEHIASEFNCAELWLTEFSPLMGYSCGTGTLGVAFYADE